MMIIPIVITSARERIVESITRQAPEFGPPNPAAATVFSAIDATTVDRSSCTADEWWWEARTMAVPTVARRHRHRLCLLRSPLSGPTRGSYRPEILPSRCRNSSNAPGRCTAGRHRLPVPLYFVLRLPSSWRFGEVVQKRYSRAIEHLQYSADIARLRRFRLCGLGGIA